MSWAAFQRPQSRVSQLHRPDKEGAQHRENEARPEPHDRLDPEVEAVNEAIDVGGQLEVDLPHGGRGGTVRRRCIRRVGGKLSAVVERLSVDGDIDRVWYADDDARHEDEHNGKFCSSLIAPLNAYLRKPATIDNYTSPLLVNLHWLRVPERIQYKLCVLVHRCLNASTTVFVWVDLSAVRPSDVDSRRRLRVGYTIVWSGIHYTRVYTRHHHHLRLLISWHAQLIYILQ